VEEAVVAHGTAFAGAPGGAVGGFEFRDALSGGNGGGVLPDVDLGEGGEREGLSGEQEGEKCKQKEAPKQKHKEMMTFLPIWLAREVASESRKGKNRRKPRGVL
jgi:hypothetical protein